MTWERERDGIYEGSSLDVFRGSWATHSNYICCSRYCPHPDESLWDSFDPFWCHAPNFFVFLLIEAGTYNSL